MVIGNFDSIPPSQINYLAERHNFVIVAPNYRLCPQVSWYEGGCTDTKDAYEWCRHTLPSLLREQADFIGSADGSRIVVMGDSAGAVLALWLVRIKYSVTNSTLSNFEIPGWSSHSASSHPRFLRRKIS
jgi:carboxylesterase type B